MQAITTPVSVFWFRRDLRLFDNHGFYRALSGPHPVLPVFIFDKNILKHLARDDRRITFIWQTLKELKEALEKQDSSLLALHDTSLAAFENLISQYEIKDVFTNNDYEPYACERDQQVESFLKSKGIAFHHYKDQVLFEKSEVLKSDDSPYTVFTPYAKKWKDALVKEKMAFYPSEKLNHNLFKTPPFRFPSLKEMGFRRLAVNVSPLIVDEKLLLDYEKTRNIPAIGGTSRMSVHLRFGTVSIRQLVRVGQQCSETWLNELIWREFFMMILHHFPRVVHESFKKKYDNILWRNSEVEFDRWCRGETGYPLVDAGMHELNETGFMHNRVRMVVASFLTKHLLIDWRWGEAYFAEKLLDYELASNNGNWQWAAGSGCDAAPYFRIFNPAEQQKKFDPKEAYIRKWLPEYPRHYTLPMIPHDEARQRAIAVYKQALHS